MNLPMGTSSFNCPPHHLPGRDKGGLFKPAQGSSRVDELCEYTSLLSLIVGLVGTGGRRTPTAAA
jgi:hypothetical protein